MKMYFNDFKDFGFLKGHAEICDELICKYNLSYCKGTSG